MRMPHAHAAHVRAQAFSQPSLQQHLQLLDLSQTGRLGRIQRVGHVLRTGFANANAAEKDVAAAVSGGLGAARREEAERATEDSRGEERDEGEQPGTP